jgi:hypothetical protein
MVNKAFNLAECQYFMAVPDVSQHCASKAFLPQSAAYSHRQNLPQPAAYF